MISTFPRNSQRDDCYDFKPETHTPAGSTLGSRSEGLAQCGRSDFIIALLSLPDETLMQFESGWAEAEERARRDGKMHSSTLYLEVQKVGAAVLVNAGAKPEGSRSLGSLCIAKKYETRAKTWIGVAFDLESPGYPYSLAYLGAEWHADPMLEKLLPVLKSPGKLIPKG